MPNILITGGAGFIGSHIAREALNAGYDVKIIDNFFEGRMENISDISNSIKIVRGDIMDISLLKKEMVDIDFVFHQAALRSVPLSLKKPFDYNMVNINGTLNTLEAALHCGVKRVVFASSSSLYGNTENLPERESEQPRPISPYAITKLAGELYMQSYYALYGLETVNLRYFNVFGPFQRPDSKCPTLIPLFINSIINNEIPTIYGDGSQSRDFTYVKDVVRANLAACISKRAAGETFNIANGKRVSVNDIARKIAEVLGKDIRPAYKRERSGDVKHSLADISKAKDILEYEPKYDFESGLKETIEWFRTLKKNET